MYQNTATPNRRDFPPDVIKRRTVRWHGIASSTLTRRANVEIRPANDWPCMHKG